MTKFISSVIALAIVFSFSLAPISVEAKGGGGGGRGGGGHVGGSRPTTSVRPSSTPKPTSVTPSKPATPPKPVVTKTPSANTVTVKSQNAKVVNGKVYSKKGNVVDESYKPRFAGGITPSAGSIVYYRDSTDWMMWIPLMYLMTHDSHREAVIETPGKDGAASTTQVVKEEGVDTMYVINWIITVLIGLGIIAGIVFLVNKFTNKREEYV